MFLVSTHLNIKIYTFYIFQVRFIWLAGKRKYKEHFDKDNEILTNNENVLCLCKIVC